MVKGNFYQVKVILSQFNVRVVHEGRSSLRRFVKKKCPVTFSSTMGRTMLHPWRRLVGIRIESVKSREPLQQRRTSREFRYQKSVGDCTWNWNRWSACPWELILFWREGNLKLKGGRCYVC